jgi:hypothetical protein
MMIGHGREYLFTFIDHLLNDALNPFKLGTHASASSYRCDGLVQGSRLVGIRHLSFPDRLFSFFSPIELELFITSIYRAILPSKGAIKTDLLIAIIVAVQNCRIFDRYARYTGNPI